MRRLLWLAVFAGGMVFAQPPRFEVASIRPSDPDEHGSSILTDRAGDLTARNVPLRGIILLAYGLRTFQLSGGPGWINTDAYDITAKPESAVQAADASAAPVTDQERKTRNELWKERMRALLADRFGLLVHREMKDQPVYLLIVGKNGSKMKEVATPHGEQGTRGGAGRSQGMAATMPMLANTLANATGRVVLDKTGLTGKYDYMLEWAPEVSAAESRDSAAVSSGPTIFTAVEEQLGLKLESAKEPVEMIVIDHVDRPSEN